MAGALGPHAVEQRAVVLDLEKGAAELALVAGFHLAAELGAHGLLAVADAEHRNAGGENGFGCARAADVDGGMRAARKNDGTRPEPLEGLFGRLERHDFAIDAGL